MFANNHHGDGHVAVWLPASPGRQAALIEEVPTTWIGVELDQVSDDVLDAHIRRVAVDCEQEGEALIGIPWSGAPGLSMKVLRLLAVSVVVLFGLQIPAAPVAQEIVPTAEDWAWLEDGDKLRVVVDTFMPMEVHHYGVRYRSADRFWYTIPEKYFDIAYLPQRATNTFQLSATLVVASGRSIQQQVVLAHMMDRTLSFETILSRVSLQKTSLTSQQCPAIGRRVAGLPALGYPAPRADIISVDPYGFEFVLDSNVVQWRGTIGDPNAPLVKWAEETLAALLACDRR